MEFWKPTLFLIGGIGVINGIVFSLLLLFTRNTKLENTFLGLLLLMICIRIGKSIYFYFTDHIDNLILQVGLSACVFIGPLFFLYTKTVNRNLNKTPKAYKVLLATIGIGIITVGLIYPYRTFPDLWNGPIIRSIYLIWGSFVLLGFIEIRVIITNALHHFPQLTASQKRLLLISGGILPGLSKGSLWRIQHQDGTVTGLEELFVNDRVRLRKCVVSPRGKLYLLTDEEDGKLIRVVDGK